MENNILISVLISCYNHEKYVEETIQSIWEQSLESMEIIAIDDGSSDGTYEVLQELQKRSPIKMYIEKHENMGLVRTLNKALRLARGKYISFMASDDKFCQNAINPLLKELEKNNSIKLVYGNGYGFDENGIGQEHVHNNKVVNILSQSTQDILDNLLTNVPRPLLIQCCMVERELLNDIGGFDTEVLLDDWPLNIRIFQYLVDNNFSHTYIEHDVALYRNHDTQTNKNSKKMFFMIEEVINKYTPEDKKGDFFAFEAFNHAKTLFRLGDTDEANILLKRALKTSFGFTNLLKYIRIYLKYNLKTLF
jgi:glycosyltransferase involved in cell wall biosynthesis